MIRALFYVLMLQFQLLWSDSEVDDWDLDTVQTRLHNYEVSLWAAGFEEIPWGMAFLPSQEMLVSDISGTLYRVSSNGKQKVVIEGVPEIFRKGQGGLLDVEIHPDFSKNSWIYLAYSDPFPKRRGFTSVARAKLIKNKLVDLDVIYRVDEVHATGKPYHFGSRLVFDQNNDLFFSIGDRGERDEAQLLTTPNGKIHRIRDNGEIPNNNPFYKKHGHIQSIWSYGNRNAQGLTIHPETGELWSTEHGPRGGDELNRIQKGLNYGWPVITYGINYIGTRITDLTEKEGMEQPVFQWTPSIALCGIKFYSGELFKKWNNHLFITSLKFERLHRVVIENNKVVDEEIIFEPGSRVRDVEIGPNHCIYVALENPGRIVILKPI